MKADDFGGTSPRHFTAIRLMSRQKVSSLFQYFSGQPQYFMPDQSIFKLGKRWIEQRQRREAKERLDAGTVWNPKFFAKDGDRWIFNEKLSERIQNVTI